MIWICPLIRGVIRTCNTFAVDGLISAIREPSGHQPYGKHRGRLYEIVKIGGHTRGRTNIGVVVRMDERHIHGTSLHRILCVLTMNDALCISSSIPVHVGNGHKELLDFLECSI